MTKVLLKENEPFDVAMRRFRRTVERTGLIQELKSRMAYEKPTTERKRKKAAAVARLRKQIRRAQLPKKFYWCTTRVIADPDQTERGRAKQQPVCWLRRRIDTAICVNARPARGSTQRRAPKDGFMHYSDTASSSR